MTLTVSVLANAEEKEAPSGLPRTLYWLGVTDRCHVAVFQRGLELVRQSDDPGLKALAADLAAQLKLAKGTFYGTYPLVRVMGPVLAGSVGPPGRYDSDGTSPVTAAKTAAGKLSDRIIAEWKAHPQLHTVLRSDDPAMLNEVLYQLARNPRFAIHPPAELAGVDWERDPRLLLERLNVSNVLVLDVRAQYVLESEGIYFYGVTGRLYQSGGAARSIGAKAITLDREAAWYQTLYAQFGLLLLALATGLLLRRPLRGGWVGWSGLALVAGAFVAARVIVVALAPLLATVAPEPEDALTWSWWWPVAAGVVLILGPVAVIRLLLPRLATLPGISHPEGNLGFVGGAAGIGTAAFLVGPLAFLDGSLAVAELVPVVVSCWALGFLFGTSVDSLGHAPAWVAGVAVALAGAAGTAVCLVDPTWLWSTAALCGLAAAAAMTARSPASATVAPTAAPASEPPADVSLTGDPAFQRLSGFAEARERLRGVVAGRTRWLCLWGRAGVGKTATALALVESLEGDVVVLHGTCPPETETPSPYQPFREALADHYSIDLLADRTTQLGKLDIALRGAMTSVFPFGQMLFPPAEDPGEVASSQREIASCIQHSLRALLAHKVVLLVIDDVHTADAATREMLRELHREFPADGETGLGVILTARGPQAYEAIGIEEAILALREPDADERRRILTDGLGIEPASATHIVQQVGTAAGERGSLIWLLQVVAHLARLQAFRRRSDGLELHGEYAAGNPLPIPEDLNTILKEQFLRHPQYKRVLECAACIGPRFALTVLAGGLDMSRLDLLDLLREIEAETGLIHDVMPDDDYFAFRSPLMLEVVRREVRVKGHGPKADDIPQIIREYHARVARAIEQRSGGAGAAIFDVARNYYAAGASHAAAGRDWCLRAATGARSSYDLDGAQRYLEMARECASVAGEVERVEDAAVLIDCDRAFFGQTDPAASAAAGLAYLAARDDAPLPVLRGVARTCHLARNSGDTARLGREIVARAQTPEEKAAGHHYVGLGQRFLSDDPADARREMRRALEILEAATEPGLPERRLQAQICNSLAETYAYGSDQDRGEARRLFETALKLREDGGVGDLAGQARTHGGLGRLYYYAPEPDRDQARHHFREDMRIAEEIGDRKGQCTMRSFLGGCDRADGLWESGLDHYRESFRLAESDLDHVFAASGRLECLGRLGGPALELEATGQELVELTAQADLPPFVWKEVRRALDSTTSDAAWWSKLRDRIDDVE